VGGRRFSDGGGADHRPGATTALALAQTIMKGFAT
jgi:hypothetical protein